MPNSKGSASRARLDPEIQKTEAGQLRSIWAAAKSQREFTQESAAHAMGWTTQGAVSQYLNGTIPMNLEAASKFATFLRCRINDFSPRLAALLPQNNQYQQSGRADASEQNKPSVSGLPDAQNMSSFPIPQTPAIVPVVGNTQSGCAAEWISAGKPREFGSHYVIHASTESMNAYALRVSGNDLAPRYVEGDCLVLDPDAKPEPGDEVVCSIAGKLVVRRLVSSRHGEVTLAHPLTGGDHAVHERRDLESMHVIVSIATPASIRKK